MRLQIQLAQARRCLTLLPGATLLIILAASTASVPAQTAKDASAPAESASNPPVTITLQDAIQRAEKSEPSYAAASATSRSSALDRSIARAGMLPGVVYHNQVLYTQPNGLQNQAGQGTAAQPAPRFIANNAVREYASQALINETMGLSQLAAVHRADADSAQAAAELEIARRGLVSAVTGLFYGVASADNKLAVAQRAHAEAADFTKLTSEREAGA